MIYPKIQPYSQTHITVGDNHALYLEQSGNKKGIPVIYLHGGPGGASAPLLRSMFDPEKYRIILFDQRGCGQSLPFAAYQHNTSQHLINDIEAIRLSLNIDSWIVAGGSWGTTLAVLYAQAFPQRVCGILLRGMFLARNQDLHWLYHCKGGAARLFPDFYQDFIKPIKDKPVVNTFDILNAYWALLSSPNEILQMQAARAWCVWEARISRLTVNAHIEQEVHDKHVCLPMAILECHYFRHESFIDENQILNNMDHIAHIPATIIHGRYDAVCDVSQAYQISQAWPASQLQIVPAAGHSLAEKGIASAFVKAGDDMAKFLLQQKQ